MNYGRKGVRAKQKALTAKSGKWGRKAALTCAKVIIAGCIALGIIGASAAIGIFNGVVAAAPVINSNDVAPVGFSTFVYDNQGNQIDKLVSSNSNRIPVTMDMIPKDLANAFVAIEDERFYEHNGIDFIGIMRSGYLFITSGFKTQQGASTITQQLLKNTIFTDWVNEENLMEKLERKIQEQYLALEISKVLSKDEILVRYLNTVNLSQNTLGVQAASLRYFNKSVSELTLSECAVIAAITQNPSRFNPISHPEENAGRRKRVLDNMLEQEMISQAQYDEAMADDVYSRIQNVNVQITSNSSSSYFVDSLTEAVYNDLIEAGYSATAASSLLYSGGLRIYSTMDPDIQAIADEEFANPENFSDIKGTWYLNYELTVKKEDGTYVNHSREMLKKWFRENVNKNYDINFNSQEDGYEAVEQYKAAILEETDEIIGENISFTIQPQMSMTIIDQSTGYVVAMVGGRGAKEGRRTFNRASDALVSPGSTFKVLAAYAPALDSAGLTLATVINDAAFAYDSGTLVRQWWDKNGARTYRGLNPLREGIRNSMNVLTVKLLTWITPQLGFDYLREFGFTTLQPDDCVQSMALGGVSGVSNLELTAAYATIANGGLYNKPKLYTKVLDSDGRVILDNTEPDSHRVLKETTAFLLTSAMTDVINTGTGKAVKFKNMSLAGKTGTATGDRALWFVGYSPYYTAAVWTGYDDYSSLNTTTKGRGQENQLSKKLWKAVMERIHENLPNQTFPIPGGIVQTQVCSRSGKLPGPACNGHIVTEYFDENTVPTDMCNICYDGLICAYTGQVACENCPFKTQGHAELPLIEDSSLWPGSTIITQNPDGTTTVTEPQTTNNCPHDAAFFEQPDAYGILEMQRLELETRGLYFEPFF